MGNEVADFLNGGGGAKAAKFADVGTIAKGEVTAVEISQQRSVEDGSLLEWKDGNPRMQLVVTIQTDESDGADDDGLRRLFAKKPGNMLTAISDAVKAAEQTAVEVGGTLAVQFTGEGERTNPAYSPPKLFKAQYKAPAKAVQSVSADELI